MKWLKTKLQLCNTSEKYCLLECDAIQSGRKLPVFLNKPVAFIFEYEKMRDREGRTDLGGSTGKRLL